MARKPEVSVDLAGDASKLEKELKKSGSSLKTYQQALDGVEDAAKRADKSMSGVEDGVSRIDKIVGKGGGDFRSYRSNLGGVGDGFNDLEDRAMGAGNIINGFGDVMKGTSQGTATFAMGLSDLAAGIRYTVVPTLQDAAKGIKNFSTTTAGMTGLIAGGAIAGVVALGFALKQIDDNRAAEWTEKFNSELETLGHLTNETAEEAFVGAVVFGDLEAQMQAIADGGGFAAVERFREQVLAMNDSEVAAALLDAEINKLVSSESAVANEIQRANDALRAQSDPAFAALDAMQGLTDANHAVSEAQAAVTAAIEEYGPKSREATEAQKDLNAAQVTAAEAAIRQESALLDLGSQMLASGFSIDDVVGHLVGLQEQGVISADTVANVSTQLRNVPGKVDSTLAANDLASGSIEGVKRGLQDLDGSRAEVTIVGRAVGAAIIDIARSVQRKADGGVVYAANGFVPRGTDTVPAMLTPGEMVLNADQQSNLFRMIKDGRGGGNVNVYVQGSIRSDQDLVRVIRDAQRRGGGI